MASTANAECIHVTQTTATARADACEECGSRVNLRLCTECGHVGCCESQYGHNTAHYRDTGHAVIKSMPIESGHFTWCYECGRYV